MDFPLQISTFAFVQIKFMGDTRRQSLHLKSTFCARSEVISKITYWYFTMSFVLCVLEFFFKVFKACNIWGFHIVDVEDSGHLGYYVKWRVYRVRMFWRNILPSECWKYITLLLSVTTQMTCILFVTYLEAQVSTLKFYCKIMQVEVQGKCSL